ncbi:MAG TPA: ribonuclease P protein component [Bacteroidales bacterium]|nr:ribonuclease P protein component [Bacteroidales bacterium]
MTGPFTFGKKERLSHRADIERLFNEGRSFSLPPFRVFYIMGTNPDAAPVRILIAVPKKKYKRAVDRNKLKRMIREAYRLNKAFIAEPVKSQCLHVGFVYTAQGSIPDFTEIESKMKSCLEKLLLKYPGMDA